jgi:hypothetical protein
MPSLMDYPEEKHTEYQKALAGALLGEALIDRLTAWNPFTQEYDAAPRVGLVARIPWDNRGLIINRLRELLDDIDASAWTKNHYTQSSYDTNYSVELVEQWEVEFDAYLRGVAPIRNTIVVRFFREAVEGMQVGTCTIGMIETRHPAMGARITENLGIACAV